MIMEFNGPIVMFLRLFLAGIDNQLTANSFFFDVSLLFYWICFLSCGELFVGPFLRFLCDDGYSSTVLYWLLRLLCGVVVSFCLLIGSWEFCGLVRGLRKNL